MVCKKCNAEIYEGEKFCRKCGASVTEDIAEPINSPANEPKKENTLKEVLSVVGGVCVVVLAIIVCFVAFGGSKSERAMKKAIATKDIYVVENTYYKDNDSGKKGSIDALKEFIKSATDTVNSEFSCNISESDDDYLNFESIFYDFCNDKWGTVFYTSANSTSGIWELDSRLDSELAEFNNIKESKKNYYTGLLKLESGENYNDYLKAVEVLAKVSAEDTLYSDAVEKSKSAYEKYVEAITSEAEEYFNDDDYSGAISLLENLSELDFEGSDEISRKISEIKKQYAEKYVQKAEDEFKSGNIDAAIGNIEAAITILPDGGYEAKLEEYKLYIPLALYDSDNWLSRSSDYRIGFDKSETAVNKTEYKNCLEYRYYKDCNPSTISWLLEGKYDIVKGVFFSPKYNSELNRTGNAYFEVYGDGKLIYTSKKISAESLPFDIEFNVTNVQKLEIKFIGSDSSVWGVDAQWYGDYAELAELTAYKTVKQ